MEIITGIVVGLPGILVIVSSILGVKYKKWKDWFKIARSMIEELINVADEENIEVPNEIKVLVKKYKNILK